MTADPVGDWRTRSLADLLAEHDLTGLPEHEFPTDGWSGARFTSIERPGERTAGPPGRFVLKRTSPTVDWISAATDDTTVREARLASSARRVSPILPYLGAAADGEEAVILMPDLSPELLAWERPAHDSADIDAGVVDQVLDRLARLHTEPWSFIVDPAAYATPAEPGFPWCPLPERLTLTARPTCARHIARGIPAGVESAGKLLAGWDAFDRQAPRAARDLVDDLSADPGPLVDALGRLPSVGLHGDLKLANVAIWPDGQIRFIDWQMAIRAPIAVELGWFLVANSASLPERPEQLLERYRTSLTWFLGRVSYGAHKGDEEHVVGDWDAQVDLARIVGLLLRGWRKGLDAEAGATLGSGVSGQDDLAEWSTLAVEAAGRRL